MCLHTAKSFQPAQIRSRGVLQNSKCKLHDAKIMQTVIGRLVGQTRKGSDSRVYWEWEKCEKKTSKINIYSMNIGCSGYFIVSNVRFLFFSLNFTTNGWLTGQRQHEYESVSHRPTVPHLFDT